MQEIISGKRYNTDTAKVIAQQNHYNNGNYSGTSHLCVTPKGNLFKWRDTNGQDLYLRDEIWIEDTINIDGYTIFDEALATKYSIIDEA